MLDLEMDEFQLKEYFEKTIDKELKFKEFFEKSVASLEPVVMAWIVDAWLEGYMKREGIREITKHKGKHTLTRVYDTPE